MAILRIWDEASQSYQEVSALVGPKGDKGDKGDTGDAGPNGISTSTDSSITGLLKGASGKVAQAVEGEDYVTPTGMNEAIAAAIGTAIEGSY